jgi:rSAM/selenodomain-associated transferase 2
MVSIVVPVLADAEAAARLLDQIDINPFVEIVIVDGGNDPRVEELAGGRPGVRLVRTRPGRGLQMNAGADIARGEWLLFLHADSTLPAGWQVPFESDTDASGGWFRFALDDPAWQARIVERMVRWRVRWLRLPYGDQGLFVRRELFHRLRGFREWSMMEDVDFARRLVKAGPVLEVPLALLTSSRRWRRQGWFRQSARNVVLVALYFAGVSPARLARWYVG